MASKPFPSMNYDHCYWKPRILTTQNVINFLPFVRHWQKYNFPAFTQSFRKYLQCYLWLVILLLSRKYSTEKIKLFLSTPSDLNVSKSWEVSWHSFCHTWWYCVAIIYYSRWNLPPFRNSCTKGRFYFQKHPYYLKWLFDSINRGYMCNLIHFSWFMAIYLNNHIAKTVQRWLLDGILIQKPCLISKIWDFKINISVLSSSGKIWNKMIWIE